MSKFNNIIANPPYNNMIDLKFLTRSINLYKDHILFVHPSIWLIDEKRRQTAFNKARELVKDNLKSADLFNGNPVFNIGLFVPCVITHIDSSYSVKNNGILITDKILSKTITYNNIYEINKFSDITVYPNLRDKILNYCKKNKSLQDVLNEGQSGDYWVNSGQIRGSINRSRDLNSKEMIKDDFYTFIPRNLNISEKPKNQREITQFGFNNKKEAENFLSYLKSSFARFCLSIYKNNQNLYCGELYSVPYLDYSKSWTDKELYKLFNLTDEEIKFIEQHISKYY